VAAAAWVAGSRIGVLVSLFASATSLLGDVWGVGFQDVVPVWNTLVRLMFGYLARDVDCGFKLIRREVLDRVPIPSDGAMIDTELLAGAKARGFRIVDVPVTHLPRVAGEATGANISVIVRALKELLDFRMELGREMREEGLPSGRAPQPQHVEVSGRQGRTH
jgi:hypothetical protein